MVLKQTAKFQFRCIYIKNDLSFKFSFTNTDQFQKKTFKKSGRK